MSEANATRNSFLLEGQHIAVLGASSGIGAQIAVTCAALGARVTLMARRLDKLEEIRSRCAPGQEHSVIETDVTDIKGLENCFKQARTQGGALDGLVYAPGIGQSRPLSVIDEKYIDSMMAVNFKGAMMATRFALSKGGMQPGGSIVLISSISALVAGGAGTSIYAASKAGLDAAKRVFAVELAPRRIRINSLVVGTVNTEIWDSINESMGERSDERTAQRHLLGIGQPEDVANAAAFLLSPASRWITGSSLHVDGGFLAHNRG
jgi:NAD(P)-dependent dehydrogenase (short-subunit alcohol dehydrogenase family)